MLWCATQSPPQDGGIVSLTECCQLTALSPREKPLSQGSPHPMTGERGAVPGPRALMSIYDNSQQLQRAIPALELCGWLMAGLQLHCSAISPALLAPLQMLLPRVLLTPCTHSCASKCFPEHEFSQGVKL